MCTVKTGCDPLTPSSLVKAQNQSSTSLCLVWAAGLYWEGGCIRLHFKWLGLSGGGASQPFL